ncbi:M28 family peptidase [Bacillus sp. M6-12]|uniref:M28 family peptidase n=1 Tax=Bacillus sp. M6-12 TaxID=2054166 RepID=UPI0035B566C0
MIDGKKNLVTDLVAALGARTAADTVIPYGQLGRSDHQPFHELGIPAALFIHSPLEKWYHSPNDTIDKIDKNKLQEAAEIVGASVYQIARPDTPALQHARVAPGPVDYDFENHPVQ